MNIAYARVHTSEQGTGNLIRNSKRTSLDLSEWLTDARRSLVHWRRSAAGRRMNEWHWKANSSVVFMPSRAEFEGGGWRTDFQVNEHFSFSHWIYSIGHIRSVLTIVWVVESMDRKVFFAFIRTRSAKKIKLIESGERNERRPKCSNPIDLSAEDDVKYRSDQKSICRLHQSHRIGNASKAKDRSLRNVNQTWRRDCVIFSVNHLQRACSLVYCLPRKNKSSRIWLLNHYHCSLANIEVKDVCLLPSVGCPCCCYSRSSMLKNDTIQTRP